MDLLCASATASLISCQQGFCLLKKMFQKEGFFKAYESADIFQKTYSLESHVSLIIRDNYWINLSAVYQKVKQNRFPT